MGAVIADSERQRDELVEWRTSNGAIPGVMEAYLALRGLRTLPVRFARQQRTAAELAERLDDHRHVERVRYPGLVTDRRLRTREFSDGRLRRDALLRGEGRRTRGPRHRLRCGSSSVARVSAAWRPRSIDEARWKGEENVPGGLLRLSVGLEHPVDLWADLDDALNSAFKSS